MFERNNKSQQALKNTFGSASKSETYHCGSAPKYDIYGWPIIPDFPPLPSATGFDALPTLLPPFKWTK